MKSKKWRLFKLLVALLGLLVFNACDFQLAGNPGAKPLLPKGSLGFINVVSGQEYELPFDVLVRASGTGAVWLSIANGSSEESEMVLMSALGAGIFSYTISAPGIYQIQAVIKGESEDEIVDATAVRTIMLLPPEVEILNPPEGALLKGYVTFRVKAIDNVGIASVKLFSNGKLLQETTVGSEGIYAFGVETTELADGAYTFLALAEDLSGNTGAASVEVTIKNSMW